MVLHTGKSLLQVDKKTPVETNGITTRALSIMKLCGDGVIELKSSYYLLEDRREYKGMGQGLCWYAWGRLVSSLRQSGSFPTTFSIRSR